MVIGKTSDVKQRHKNALSFWLPWNEHPVNLVVNGKECSVIHDEVTWMESSSLFQKVMIALYK